jgi:hypothetical protein
LRYEVPQIRSSGRRVLPLFDVTVLRPSNRLDLSPQERSDGEYVPWHSDRNLSTGSCPGYGFRFEGFHNCCDCRPRGILESTSHCSVPSGACTILTVPVMSATISVGRLTATIQSSVAVFDNQTFPALGLQRQTTRGDLLDLQGRRVFETYALNSDLGPSDPFFRTPTALGQFNCAHGCLLTSLGTLTIDRVQNVKVTATRATSLRSSLSDSARQLPVEPSQVLLR